jgi:hypothetical protein
VPRGLAIAAVILALVGVGVVDRYVARAAPASARVITARSVSQVHPPGAESTSWYCAGGTGYQGGAPATIVMANGSSHPVRGTLTAVTALAASAGSAAAWSGAHTVDLLVPAGQQLAVGPDQLGAAGFVAAAVVLDGGGVAVTQAVSSPLGWSMAPCASTTGPNWYFAHGATAQGGGLLLSLFNPGATDATVDVSMISATAGLLAPAAYQGIDVPPGSLVTENLGEHAPADGAIATMVSALSGTLVATELESSGTPGAGGLSLSLGSPAPATEWVFPQNTGITGSSVVFHVFDPSTSPAVVSVAIGLPAGAAAEPLTFRLPGQGQYNLVAGNQTRIPVGTPYALTFTSRGPGILVARQVTAPSGLPAPIPEEGVVPGVPGSATRWLVPATVAPGTGAWSMAVLDLGSRPTAVRVTTPTGGVIASQPQRRVLPGVPLVIGPNPGAPFGTAPVMIVATQPVAVELDALPVAGPGVVVVPALSLG